MPHIRLFAALVVFVALAACAAPDRAADLDNIAANLAQTQKGAFGEALLNLNEAGDKARAAAAIHDEFAAVPASLNADLAVREQALRLAEEAAEHRRRAERIVELELVPLRHLEALHVPAQTATVLRSVYFARGSATLDQTGRAAVAEVAEFLGRYPIAQVTITGYADPRAAEDFSRGLARERGEAIRKALGFFRPPISTPVQVEEISAAEAQAADKLRRVDILVAPHGATASIPAE